MRQLFSGTRAVLLPVLAMLLTGAASVWAASVEDSIIERIKPVGSLCVEGEPCAAALQTAASGPRSAEEVYNSGCASCHASGAAGAPKFRNADDWASRLGAGLETLYANSINGIRGMPPRGVCPTCSDDEVKAAVDYMIEGL